jgi:hypothetical protein
MYSVRFHLARGNHYRHWQIRDLDDKHREPLFLDPIEYQIKLEDCTLYNNERKAQQVYDAGVKDVCGWVKCRDFGIANLNDYDPEPIDDLPRLLYNPIDYPYWRREDSFENIDGTHFDELITYSNKVYIYTHQYTWR